MTEEMTRDEILKELLLVINDIETYTAIEGGNSSIVKNLNHKKKYLENKLIEIGG